MKLPEPYLERLLHIWPVARLVTLGEGGRPHAVPIVFVWHDGAVWSPIDAKPKGERELQRVRNLRRDPRTIVLLDRYEADWTQLWWIRLEGSGELLSVPRPERDATLGAPAAMLRAKYPQYGRIPLFRNEPSLLRLRIERRTSWCASETVLAELRQL
jgi:PPOX class probable F420-dependent enzyme